MKPCLILNIPQQRVNVLRLLSCFTVTSPEDLTVTVNFLKNLLFLLSRSAFDFILASEFFFVDELECDWSFQNIFRGSRSLIG